MPHKMDLKELTEQTGFLLEKQKESHKECDSIYKELSQYIKKSLDNFKGLESDRKSLVRIGELVTTRANDLNKEIQADIDFLTEQYEVLTQLRAMSDQKKAYDILKNLIDENDELSPTDEFKKSIVEEYSMSKQNLLTMVDDIKEALKEGNFKEIELAIENAIEEATKNSTECGCCEECDETCSCEDYNLEIKTKKKSLHKR